MDEVGRLINLVGAREAVEDERLERARQNVRAHWEQVVAEQRINSRPRRLNIIAMAASVVVVVGAAYLLWNLSYTPPTYSLASVDRVLGEVLIADELVGKGSAVSANTEIVTGSDSRIALRMSGGQSLRIDTASRVILHTTNHVSLETGAVYIDTATVTDEQPLRVSTPLGTAKDIGTQFQVRVTAGMLVVGVRQGLVEVSQPGKQNLSINKGYYVELDTSGESGEQPLQADDPDWDWIETITPEFEIQNASLEQYLQWYARESGLNLVWADKESESKAKAALLVGSVAGTSLDESLMLVKQVAPFEHKISLDSLWVKVE